MSGICCIAPVNYITTSTVAEFEIQPWQSPVICNEADEFIEDSQVN